jgi:hypothetical protein
MLLKEKLLGWWSGSSDKSACLLSKHKVLSSNPSAAQNINK